MYDSDLLRITFFKPSKTKVEKLIEYLNHISGKDLTLAFIRQYLLKVKWKEKESILKYRCNCKAASIYLKFILLTNKVLNKREIKIIIADITPYVAKLDPNHITSFILANTNTLPSTIHYKHAQYLFYKHDLPDESKHNYDTDLLVLYALRLSLEKRILGFLGIDYATSGGKPIGISRLFKIIKNLENIKYSPTINWQEIEWVNHWLNHHMHRHLRPSPWEIHQAFEITNNLLLSSKYNHENKEIHSFYGSTVVFDEEKLTKEILTKLKNEDINIEVKWTSQKEILKMI